MTEIEIQLDGCQEVVDGWRVSVTLTRFHLNQSQSNALKHNEIQSHVPILSVYREH